MGQIVSARINENGNYVLEVRPLGQQTISKEGRTIHVGGTIGWSEPLAGLFIKDPEGVEQQLFCTIDIRYRNPYRKIEKPVKPLTADDLKKAVK